jgi:hypothetical protein
MAKIGFFVTLFVACMAGTYPIRGRPAPSKTLKRDERFGSAESVAAIPTAYNLSCGLGRRRSALALPLAAQKAFLAPMSAQGVVARMLARFPFERNRSRIKKSRQIKKLERILIAKVYQLLPNSL